jgi:hypothetical protein
MQAGYIGPFRASKTTIGAIIPSHRNAAAKVSLFPWSGAPSEAKGNWPANCDNRSSDEVTTNHAQGSSDEMIEISDVGNAKGS